MDGILRTGRLREVQGPIQRAAVVGHCRRETQAVVDAGLDLGALLVIIPSSYLGKGQLIATAEVTAMRGLLERLQPGLSALLAGNARGWRPRRQGVIETLPAGACRNESRIALGRALRLVIEMLKVNEAVSIRGIVVVDPGERAVGLRVGETAAIAINEKVGGVVAVGGCVLPQCGPDVRPVRGRIREARLADKEVDDGTTRSGNLHIRVVDAQITQRSEVVGIHVVEIG